jgi:hypothetical protein
MPFALDGTLGEVLIHAQGIAHRIGFRVDQLRQEPRITHETAPSNRKTGTLVTIKWPNLAEIDPGAGVVDDENDRLVCGRPQLVQLSFEAFPTILPKRPERIAKTDTEIDTPG